MAVIKTFSSSTVLTLTILLYSDCLLAASLGAHRYDPGAFKESMYAYPNPDMVKALEFIENLRQNSEDTSIPDYEARGTFRPFQESLFKKLEGDDEENQRSDTIRESLGEGRAEWAKLLLQAVMQAESKAASVSGANGKHYNSGTGHHNQEEDTVGFEGNQQDYDGHELSESNRNDKLSRKHHVAFPEYRYRVNPYKRTNEIVEEQYTPQSLATLESAFRELGKYTGPYKEQEGLEDEYFRKDEEEDISRGSDFAYEDVADGEDWNSVEMKNRHLHKEVQFQDEETEVDRDSDRAANNVKKSLAGFNEVNLDQLDSQEKATMEKENEDEMSDAAADLMLQYYKRLQERMYEEQSKRDIGKTDESRNVENEKMTIKPSRGSEDEIDPRIVDQLVELSSRLQIPPDDIVKMLKDAEQKKQADPAEIESDLPYNGAESSEMDTGREKKRFRDSYTRGHIVPDNGDEDLTTEDILNILGVDDRMYEKPAYFRKADQSKNRLSGIHVPFERFKGNRNHESLRNGDGMGRGQTDDQDINTDDEELVRYLERMLAKNPDFLNSADTPRPRMSTPVGDQVEAVSYQDPIKELLRDINPRKAAEVMSIINNLSSFTGNDYHTLRRQQKGEDSSSLILKLMELISQQNDDRDRPVKESNREILGSDD